MAAVLSEHPGHAFCKECLARRTGLDASVAWAAAVELGESSEYEVDEGICSHCLDEIEDVAHVEWVSHVDDHVGDRSPEPRPAHRIRFTLGPPAP